MRGDVSQRTGDIMRNYGNVFICTEQRDGTPLQTSMLGNWFDK